MSQQTMKITDILQQIHQNAEQPCLSIGEIVEAFEGRGYGPLLMAAGLIIMLPPGWIPGVPSIMALVVLLIAIQMLIGLKAPWLPSFLANRSVEKQQFIDGFACIKPYTQRIDQVLHPRMTYLFNGLSQRGVATACIVMACSIPPLELIPLAALIPAFAITLLGLSLSVRDGYLMIAAGIVLLLGGLWLMSGGG